ncbi:MAG TPA: preprotein translocase subunit SecG [Mucilaginibacter sp.]|jgi:preprotein translocase subunit SecG|nr:preprotein translocase subunit SecG [Mucilaginibacter sp.]
MIQLLLIIALLICVFLVLIVLIQNPKGGGLSSNFSSSSQLMGVQKTGDFLEKGTWGLAIFLMVLAMAINVAVKGGSSASSSDGAVSKADLLKKQAPAQNTASPFSNGVAGKANPSTPPANTPAQKPAK